MGKPPALPGDHKSLTIPAIGEPSAGRIPATRPCAYADLHPAQVCGGPGGGVYERQECHPHRARTYLGQRKNYSGMSFWTRGYLVSTVGADETVVRAYIRDQEQEDQRLEQLHLFK